MSWHNGVAMRIGINLLFMLPGVVGGTETYARELLYSLEELNEDDIYVLFMNRESAEWKVPRDSRFIRVTCEVNARNPVSRYLYEQFRLPFLLKKEKIDILHSLGYMGPVFTTCRSIVSIHDLLYDYPGSPIRKLITYTLLNLVARFADKVITISNNSKKQIQERLRVDASRIVVTYLAPKDRSWVTDEEKQAIRERMGIKGKYILAFSSLSPSKNIPRLIEAYSGFSAVLQEDYRLILVGHIPRDGSAIATALKKTGIASKVVFTGYRSDQEIAALLGGATIFVFPSLYEGFGIPVLEAMAARVPVASSTAASLPEVYGDAAVTFDPLSLSEMTDALLKLARDPVLCDICKKRGVENVKRFSWSKAARETHNLYVSLVPKKNAKPELKCDDE